MSYEYNVERAMRDTPYQGPPAPVRPLNCKEICPYGREHAFCYPCINKILAESRTVAG